MRSDTDEKDFLLSSYDFSLPETSIAQNPPQRRGDSRLLVVEKNPANWHSGPVDGVVSHEGHFADILQWLPERCLLIANNSKVIPARVFGKRKSGGKVECLLLTPPPLFTVAPAATLPFDPCDYSSGDTPRLQGSDNTSPLLGWNRAEVECLLKSSKQIKKGEAVFLANDLVVVLQERGEFGRCRAELFWKGDVLAILDQCGTLPLPPYIKRGKEQTAENDNRPDGRKSFPAEKAVPHENAQGLVDLPDVAPAWGNDGERYQTTYAREDKAGSVAAPTAGLHFTPELRQALQQAGHEWADVTLYVGYGTFSPVRSEDIREHEMHAEYVELSEETIRKIATAKAEGRPVITIGTTATRVLEGVYTAQHADKADTSAPSEGVSPLAPYSGWINIFLYPGKRLHVIDGLITNFHLPHSSLLMLVSALTGRERMLSAYAFAVEQGFRFFSYGDAMLIR